MPALASQCGELLLVLVLVEQKLLWLVQVEQFLLLNPLLGVTPIHSFSFHSCLTIAQDSGFCKMSASRSSYSSHPFTLLRPTKPCHELMQLTVSLAASSSSGLSISGWLYVNIVHGFTSTHTRPLPACPPPPPTYIWAHVYNKIGRAARLPSSRGGRRAGIVGGEVPITNICLRCARVSLFLPPKASIEINRFELV